ncbi:MAG: hypothetical protein MUC49_15725 [Raineya sp.]|jgi:hypothetical protein|nr:hypothetical protein [Raineya sp.]
MNTLEIAQKCGVPTPQTSQELNWQSMTLFVWIDCQDEGGVICVNDSQIDNLIKHGITFKEIALAPQFHEIAPKLPETIYDHYILELDESEWIVEKPKEMHDEDVLNAYHLWQNERLIGYYHEEEGESCHFRQKIENHHHAEACAKLYIQLKNENLLCKSLENKS